MPRDDDARLLDMLIACRKAMRFVADVSWEEFIADEKLQFAVLHCLSIIGEAGWSVSQETRRQHDSISWGEIRGMRNRIQHEYFAVNLPIVWEVIQTHVPALVDQLKSVLSEHEEGQGELFS